MGLIPRGGFNPAHEGAVPGNAATMILVGNVGLDMWGEFTQMPFELPHALDHWSKCVIDAVASSLAAEALYPFGCSLFMLFQRWAQKAESVHSSPLGILIHLKYGIWHAYRGLLWPSLRSLICRPVTSVLGPVRLASTNRVFQNVRSERSARATMKCRCVRDV
jgi:hypothetical protein